MKEYFYKNKPLDWRTSWLGASQNDNVRPQSQWQPDSLSWWRSVEMSKIENSATPKQQTLSQRHPGNIIGTELGFQSYARGKLVWDKGLGTYLRVATLANPPVRHSVSHMILLHDFHFVQGVDTAGATNTMIMPSSWLSVKQGREDSKGFRYLMNKSNEHVIHN